MNVSWLGNSTFLLKNSLGKRILIDPINKFYSFDINDYNPSIVTFSSYSDELSCIPTQDKSIEILKTPGEFDTELGSIIGIKSFADNYNGAKRGPNIIYVFHIDGLKICHLGYLGCSLSPDILEYLKNLDILFVPVGGNVNLDAVKAYKLCKILLPKIIIPMNYKINNTSFLFKGLQDFILLMKNSYKVQNSSFSVTKNNINEYNETVVILSHN